MKISHIGLILALISFLFLLQGCPDGDPLDKYPMPGSLALSLGPASTAEKCVPPCKLQGVIESRIGTPTDMKIYFESSEDLVVSPASDSVEQLPEGQQKVYTLNSEQGTGKPDAGGTWVRLRVVYLPDYDALLKDVTDPKLFPPEVGARWAEIIKKNKASGALQTDAVRYFLKDK
jgi:hypothetical protein